MQFWKREQLRRFVDSAEESYRRIISGKKEVDHGGYDEKQAKSREASETVQPPDANRDSALSAAVQAAVTLGIKRGRAAELARQSTGKIEGEILAFILRNH